MSYTPKTQQATAIAKAVDELATKADLASALAETEARLRAEMAEMEQRLTQRIDGNTVKLASEMRSIFADNGFKVGVKAAGR